MSTPQERDHALRQEMDAYHAVASIIEMDARTTLLNAMRPTRKLSLQAQVSAMMEVVSATAASDFLEQCVLRSTRSGSEYGTTRIRRYAERALVRGIAQEVRTAHLSADIVADSARRNAAEAVLRFITTLED